MVATYLLVDELKTGWGLDGSVTVRLLKSSVNDTFEVSSPSLSLIARIYGWRPDYEVAYELDLLRHLAARGVSVAAPVDRLDAHPCGHVGTGGDAHAVALFTRAPGVPPPTTRFPFRGHGRLLGSIHLHSEDFATPHARRALDADEILERPISVLRDAEAAPSDLKVVEDLAARASRVLSSAERLGLDHGPCHGDLVGNTHLDRRHLTAFDFDSGGPGWRAWDLAVVRLQVDAWAPRPHAAWASFITGYRSTRDIKELDLKVVDEFVDARWVWLAGLHQVLLNQGRAPRQLLRGTLDRARRRLAASSL